MGLGQSIDRLVGWISPKAAFERQAYREALEIKQKQQDMRRNYDVGMLGRFTNRANAAWGSAELVDKPYRQRILLIARDLERNNDIAKSIINPFERNVIGLGINVQAKTSDDALNQQLEEVWDEWCEQENCDVTGQLTFTEMQRMNLRRITVDGDIAVVKIYDPNAPFIPFRLQLIEADVFDTTLFENSETGNRIYSGVEVDAMLRPVAYWFQQSTLDHYSYNLQSLRIPADQVLHLFTKQRVTQVRGMSLLASSIEAIQDIGDYLEAERVKARISACFAAYVETTPQGVAGRLGQMPQDHQKHRRNYLEPGIIEYLLPGEKMDVASPSGINSNTRDFVQTNYRISSAGQGLSYEATSRDVSQVNYSSARHSALEDRRTYQPVQQWLINHFNRDVYKEVITAAVLCGRLKIPDFFTNQRKYLKHKWLPPGWDWVDPLKDVQASKLEYAMGLTTLEQLCAEQGKDYKDIIEQQARERILLKEKGINIDAATGVVKVTEKTEKEEDNGEQDRE
ncbi:phage portal protein [Sporomusa termitida]|uniref:Phage portal protein, lambda family n=1 Tax=Sporomusa termitida TaxID=2377 RepID=A0A517DVH0_9FIRM|nr:phage portal protein [Sporomusa termitida]QDR81352.1 phage portal protein, lambda family [Sporomusa termitida]